MSVAARYILGSRSPRRRELLGYLVPSEQIDVVPPESPDEPDFAGLETWDAIERRLREIARGKLRQVVARLSSPRRSSAVVIAADTVIVAGEQPPYTVLGQPPEDHTWRDVVRNWFCEYYAGKTHRAATAVCVAYSDGSTAERVVTTAVTMRPDLACLLDWYLATGEPIGKAGGYALQGAGSVFIASVEGSLSNVVGLPLEALLELLPPRPPA